MTRLSAWSRHITEGSNTMDRLLNNLLALAILATLLGVPAYIHHYWRFNL